MAVHLVAGTERHAQPIVRAHDPDVAIAGRQQHETGLERIAVARLADGHRRIEREPRGVGLGEAGVDVLRDRDRRHVGAEAGQEARRRARTTRGGADRDELGPRARRDHLATPGAPHGVDQRAAEGLATGRGGLRDHGGRAGIAQRGHAIGARIARDHDDRQQEHLHEGDAGTARRPSAAC